MKDNSKRIIILILISALIIGISSIVALINLNSTTIEEIAVQSIQGNTAESEYDYGTEMGKVIVKYADIEGNEIAESETQEGIIGTEYETSRKEISHYTSSGEEPFNKIGNYKEEDIIVVYTYKPTEELIHTNTSENNTITIQVENEKQNRDYKLVLMQESEEGKKLTGGKFSVQKDTKLVQGTTTNGQLTLGSINVNSEGTENYEICEEEAPIGYEKALKDENFDMEVEKQYNEETKQYELSATSENNVLKLEQTQDDEIVVTVTNSKIKTYELAMKKFASSVDEVSTQREVRARIDTDGKLVYDELEQKIEVRDYEKVIYTLRIFNEGNQDMEGKTVTDILPSGLKYLSESEINKQYGWEQTQNTLKTDYLIGKTIEGFDIENQETPKYIDIQLEVEVVEDEANEDNILTNTSSITIDEREKDQSNNEDADTLNLVRMPKTYDFAIKKFASSINGEDTLRNVTVKLNDLKQIEYEENRPEKTVKEDQKVTYTLRVFNEGNQNIQGTKITDVIPKGLVFDTNSEINTEYGWTLNGSNVETSYLVNKTINGVKTYRGEIPNYIDLQIEFTVTEDEVEEDDLIVNEARIEKNENETDDLDNIDTDTLSLERKPKTYDFAIKKFASSIDGEDTSRNVTVDLNENNEIVYNEKRPEKSVKDEQKVVYTLRIFNEGNQDLKGEKVIDEIPAGLKYLSESEINKQYGWQINGDNIETSYLTDKTIKGCNLSRKEIPQYTDIKVEFEVTEDGVEDTVNTITNRSKIEKNVNETDLQDNENTDELNLNKREKTYDLNIKKFATSIDGIDTGRNITVDLTDNNEIQYTQIKPEKVVEEGQKITYTLRVFNEGNQDIQGTKITEDLPKGLKYYQNSETNKKYGWELKEGKLETDYLTDKTIKGSKTYKGEVPNYIDVKIELEVTREGLDENSYAIINTASIEKHEKETDISDNESSDTVTLEKKGLYDYAMKKFASSIDGIDTGRNVTVSLTENSEIIYTEVKPEKQVKDGQKVIYTLRIFNEGNKNLEGSKVIEEIPEGLKYLTESEINKQYGWTINNDKLESNYLIGKILSGADLSKGELPRYIDMKVEFEVVEDEANENNLIMNTAKIEKDAKETDELDNTDTDILNIERKVKTYDFAMKKFVNTVDGEKLGKDIIASINENGRIVYTANTTTDVNKGQAVVFTLRIFNEGNQDMKGKKITDIIPQGLKYLENSEINKKYNWIVEENNVSTNYLVGKNIKGFDIENNEQLTYEDVQIELEVTGEEILENGLITNVAKVEAGDNETELEDNEDECILKLIPEKQKVFDLSMKKFLYSVDGEKLTNREIVAKNVDGKIEYSENEELYKVSNNQKLIFTLRVFNVGDGNTFGRDVYDYIPEGLEFIEDSEINKANEWKMYKLDKSGNLIEVTDSKDATVVKSEKLKAEEIPGFVAANNELPKFVDIQVELEVNENKVKDENRIITNTAKIEETRLELNEDNDKSEEKVQVKVFDLELTKYIKTITINDDTGEKTIELGLNKKGQILKKEINAKKIDKTQIYVTYGLKVKNIGEIPGYAGEIVDYIPENFELVNTNNKWEQAGNIVKSTSLEKELINPNEEKTIEVTFRWDLNEENLGERNNKAIITKYENDYEAKDNTEDNKNEEKFIISIRTGEMEITAIIILVILIIAAGIVKLKLLKNGRN